MKVERTSPGSKNKWKITYDNGSQKWTNDRPGDGVGDGSGDQIKETMSEPSVKRGLKGIETAIKGDGDIESAVNALVRDVGKEKGRTVLNHVYKKKKSDSDSSSWDKARKMVGGNFLEGLTSAERVELRWRMGCLSRRFCEKLEVSGKV